VSPFTEGRDNVLHHIVKVKQWQYFYDKNHKSANQQRKEYYPLHISVANDKFISDTDSSELEKKYKVALVSKNAAEKIKNTQDPKEFPAYENISKAIYSFIKNKCGPVERTFEEMITTLPISAQHNPWHGGSLNGNDIEIILEYVEWVFSTLKSLTTTDETLSKELSEIEEVWDCFSTSVPILRSTRLLNITESVDMNTYIKDFGELFTKNTTKNPTPKMQSLFCHVEACLKKYGTVGLFAEYSLEVNNALVNRIVAVFQSLDGGRQTKQVLHFFSSHETPDERNSKKRRDCPRKNSQGCEEKEKEEGDGCRVPIKSLELIIKAIRVRVRINDFRNFHPLPIVVYR
jgi:hypothetical protein